MSQDGGESDFLNHHVQASKLVVTCGYPQVIEHRCDMSTKVVQYVGGVKTKIQNKIKQWERFRIQPC